MSITHLSYGDAVKIELLGFGWLTIEPGSLRVSGEDGAWSATAVTGPKLTGPARSLRHISLTGDEW